MDASMTFVPTTPLLSSSRASALAGRSLTPSTAVPTTPLRRPAVVASVEFQTYSGGLDRVSIDPYTITRYLFKDAPASASGDNKDVVITAALRQLFGNAYLMEEERAEFYTAESRFRSGFITAKEFARAVAKSDTYRERFFENVTQFRFIELNFKHFLGRAPLNQVEYSKHFKIFAEGGYEAEIDSYFDDAEYDDVFGSDVMPFTRFRGTYAPISQFNRMCAIQGGFAGSDKNKPQKLVSSLAANVPIPAYEVADGLPSIPNTEHPSKKYDLPPASLERYRNELNIAKARVLELEIDLKKSYDNLDTYRSGFDMFKNMVADMDIEVIGVYKPDFKGKVDLFPGWTEGSPAPWGRYGVDKINGPTRRPAAVVGEKEKKLEAGKQLVVDLERRVAVLGAERETPALTPEPIVYELQGLPVVLPKPIEEELAKKAKEEEEAVAEQEAVQVPDTFDKSTIITGEAEAEDSKVVVPKKVVVQTKRELQEVGRLPKELMKELEEKSKAEGKDFGGPKDGRLEFPGDGSEMIVGG